MEDCKSPRVPPLVWVAEVPAQSPPLVSVEHFAGRAPPSVHVGDHIDHLARQLEQLHQEIKQTLKEEVQHVIVAQERIESLLTQVVQCEDRRFEFAGAGTMVTIKSDEEDLTSEPSLSSPWSIGKEEVHKEITVATKAVEQAILRSSQVRRPQRSVTYNRNMDEMYHRPFRASVERVLSNKHCDLFFGLLIIMNSLAIGGEIEYMTQSASPSKFFFVLSLSFAAFFIVELALRLAANYTWTFFCGPDAAWNIFDVVMVLVSVTEVVDSSLSSGDHSGAFRIVRMARLLRIIRVMRFVPPLRMMIFMIFESLKSLCWLLIILVSILYSFSIVFTMGATDYLRMQDAVDYSSNEVAKHYGTVMRSLYSCFKAITSGQSWGELMNPLFDVGPFYVLVFAFYISFSVIALLNTVTGIFVDVAMEKSGHDRALVAQKEIANKKALVHNLRTLFKELDEDHSGTLSIFELQKKIEDPRFAGYLLHLNIDTTDPEELFGQLDKDANGNLDVEEFIENLLHLVRGQTTEQYVQKLVKENRAVKKHLNKLMKFVFDEFRRFRRLMGKQSKHTKSIPHKIDSSRATVAMK